MKKIKRLINLLLILTVLLFSANCKKNDVNADNDAIYQYSTINALLEGIFDGELTLQELKKHGDFGIGTFNGLDGELIAIDNEIYSIKSDGKTYLMEDNRRTPFGVITFFDINKSLNVKGNYDYKGFTEYLDKNIPSKNLFYALKVTGVFKYIKTRSVPIQKKPYPKLSEVTKSQPVFEFHNIKGTLVGFRVPEYAKGINVSGYHFHFIDEAKKTGGHLLDFDAENLKVEIDFSKDFILNLPDSGDFININLSEEKENEIKKVEK